MGWHMPVWQMSEKKVSANVTKNILADVRMASVPTPKGSPWSPILCVGALSDCFSVLPLFSAPCIVLCVFTTLLHCVSCDSTLYWDCVQYALVCCVFLQLSIALCVFQRPGPYCVVC